MESGIAGNAEGLSGAPLENTRVEVTAHPMLEIRSPAGASDRFASQAEIRLDNGDTLVLHEECTVGSRRLSCGRLGAAPLLSDRVDEIGRRVVTVDLSRMPLDGIEGSLYWFWGIDDSTTAFGVIAGDPCYSSGGSVQGGEETVSYPIPGRGGEVQCKQKCMLTCVGYAGDSSPGQYQNIAGTCVEVAGSCVVVGGPGNNIPQSQPPF